MNYSTEHARYLYDQLCKFSDPECTVNAEAKLCGPVIGRLWSSLGSVLLVYKRIVAWNGIQSIC